MIVVAISVAKPHELRLSEAPVVTAAAGEVAIRVARAGICGSDIHILHGSNPFAKYPRIIGHEVVGTVDAVGDGVVSHAVGDRVVIDPVVACGHCYPCRHDRPNVCAHLQVIGVHRDGGFRERIAVPAANAIRISAGIEDAVACLAEPLSIAANVLERTGIHADDTVLILGAGTVGLTVLQVARLHGARCIVCDLDEARLERAVAFGADRVLLSGRDDIAAEVAGETDGLGPTLVIDGTGVPALLDLACRVASPAGRIGLLGFAATPSPLSQQQVVSKELLIVGSRLNRGRLPQVVAWLEEGKLSPGAMVTQCFAAEDAVEAFRLIEDHPDRTVKVQLTF